MKGDEGTRFVRVEFSRFKAFKRFSLSLRHFNILVGPNNAGKSTILAAFRILAAGMRRAYSRNPEVIRGPVGMGMTHGYRIDLSSISVAEENLFYNYDDSEAATVRFKISNSNELLLYPNLSAWLSRMHARPAFQRSIEKGGAYRFAK
jgi:AAA15 family ATPase/GTPase